MYLEDENNIYSTPIKIFNNVKINCGILNI